MVVHQHIGVQLTPCGEQGLLEQMQGAEPVAIIAEAGQAVVAALHDVLGNARQIEAWQSGHGVRMDYAAVAVASLAPCWLVGGCCGNG